MLFTVSSPPWTRGRSLGFTEVRKSAPNPRVTKGQNLISKPAVQSHTPRLSYTRHTPGHRGAWGEPPIRFSSWGHECFHRALETRVWNAKLLGAWTALRALHRASGLGRGSRPTSVAWELGERAIKLTGSRKEEEGGKLVAKSRKARFQFA